jgi:hypothetical protein
MPWPCVALLAVMQAAPSPSPSPSPPPPPAPLLPRRLRLDIDKHVDSVMQEKGGPPRFEDAVEVWGRTPEAALADQLRDFDLECGPNVGPPTAAETTEFRPHPAASLDLGALARLLSGAATRSGPPRYFLYRVLARGGAEYLLREGALAAAPGQQPVAAFELVGSFPDLASAVNGFQRMERGFGSPERASAADASPPWATTNCRLRSKR